jgi:hypothetical protein
VASGRPGRVEHRFGFRPAARRRAAYSKTSDSTLDGPHSLCPCQTFSAAVSSAVIYSLSLMDPARTKKVARKADEAAARPPPARFDRADGSSSRGSSSRGGGRGGRGGMRGGGRGGSSASSSAPYGGRSEGRRADGSGPDRSSTYQQRPGRSTPYARPGAASTSTGRGDGAGDESAPAGPAPTKAQASLSLSNLPLPAPLPSLASHPHLNRLDLSKVAGGLSGVGAGWIGDAFGAQLTWLNLSHCSGLGEAGPGAWRGFDKLTGLVGASPPTERSTRRPR